MSLLTGLAGDLRFGFNAAGGQYNAQSIERYISDCGSKTEQQLAYLSEFSFISIDNEVDRHLE